MTHPPLALDRDGVCDYLAEVWPEAAGSFADGLVELEPGFARFVRRTGPADVRPGGTVSGPTLMHAVDEGGYALVLGHLGPAALAVTSHLSMDFLRRPTTGDLVVDVELLKLGRTQVPMAARVFVDDPGTPPVAVATIVYSRALVAGEG
ncbi:PaaI family thioesterase [Euzebya sp.]|uniref:PaaI family thioesterase n=1 Tax=Euzebya sp. TaxID=1971409 RepID=UPI003516C2EE